MTSRFWPVTRYEFAFPDSVGAVPHVKKQRYRIPVAVRRGSPTVKIYREQKASGCYFRVTFYSGGKRCRMNGAEHSEADANAAQLSREELKAIRLTGRDRRVRQLVAR